ncbi:cytochrome-c oxidase, cbb3-type subunit III [Ideonella dechloratans]|uniref:Cbb3-type cytochrome c oxidase subunit n=1 Tax=Ideonella dechloratans TaxID=36863 RepID=A0A643FG25_IDEDE|nr:cytochrome-c oxidase, cbb3-type subunit III [Ideonella dechloratans]KAB0584067.1 cytochrome-c oxidase, cbb3-type subunit III [Ideonella dechloratans]UFU08770.1 cytochrome-c oxidase, cbb3-type subunit III [Ideonella dechloratans]
MSDFFNIGWSVYIAAIVIGGLVFCLALLIIASRRRVMADDNSTGHVWDEDLKEMNNPLPRWWMGLFVITVVFAAIYLALYPGLGANKGTLQWSAVGQLQAENEKARAAMAPVYASFANLTAADLAKNSQAMAIGERLFVNNCAQCHGSDARGSKGFPNLTDKDWLGGDGSPEYIEKTILNGRQGVMPVMAPAVGTPEDVRNVANYVLSLSGSPHNSVAAQLGKPKFVVCAACHGPEGKGNPVIGAPNLTDKIWLHGWGEQAVMDMVNHGKTNVMPPQGQRFTPEQIKVLTAYVWNLSQNTKVAAQ